MLHVLEVKVPDSVIWESLRGRISDKWILQIRRTILNNERETLLKEKSALISDYDEIKITDRLNIIRKELQELSYES